MTSRPLFSMVAESMVMRRPITQVGCLSACSGVMPANWSSGGWRNGPPEAVSQMVLTSLCAPTRRHWCTALCSLSMGRMGTLRSRAAAVRISPAATMHSLLARPTACRPGWPHGWLRVRQRPQSPRPQSPLREAWSRQPCPRCREQLRCPRRPPGAAARKICRPALRWPSKPPAAASARPAQRPRRGCGRRPARPPE